MTNHPREHKRSLDPYVYFNLHVHETLDLDPKTTFFIQSYDLNTEYPDLETPFFFSAGMHPWNVSEESMVQNVEFLKNLDKEPNFLAIGEIGFDSLSSVGIELQAKSFKVQAELAEELKKPAILHCVKSYSLLFEMKKKIQPKMPWILHGYRKNLNLAKDLISKGFYLSIGSILLKDLQLQNTIRNLPLTHLFLETDDSRESIKEITECLCKIKNISHDNFIDIQKSLYSKIFSS